MDKYVLCYILLFYNS